MTTHVSTDYTDYQKLYDQANEQQGEEKLQRLRILLEKIGAFEAFCATSWDIPFYTIKKVKDLIPDVQAGINRLTAAKRKKSET
jgi:hypothetical protein